MYRHGETMDNKEEKMKKTRVWQMTADTAQFLFVIVGFLKDHGTDDSRELREYVLNWLGEKEYVDRIYDTDRHPDQVVEDFRSHGFMTDDRREKYDKDTDGEVQ